MKKCSTLESHLGFWIRFVSNHVSASFEKKLEEMKIGVAEWVVLRTLYDHKTLPPSILAESIGMTRGAMSKLLDRLIVKELIEREEAKNDRRFQEIKLTEKGKILVPQLAVIADLNDEKFFGHLPDEEKKDLIKIFKQITILKKLKNVPTK